MIRQILLLLSLLFPLMMTAQTVEVLQGSITTSKTLNKETRYLLRGLVYVKDGATLTIEPGTYIFGEKQSKGALIITRTGKIIAEGRPDAPIVFTSNQADGRRTYGDWSGLVVLGNAPVNCINSTCVGEGNINNAGGDGLYGGNNPDDSSGVLRYVRIEFAGIAAAPGSEINGLTLGGVGRKTVIEYIQVSFCGDDSYEWYGGNVESRYLIAFNGRDDDFDTDLGFTGKVQFAASMRLPNIADDENSNGFESDNTKFGDGYTPFTEGVFSNVTVIGPIEDLNNVANVFPTYYAGVFLTRNTKLSVYNSVVMGWPRGLVIDGNSTEFNARNNDIRFQNNIIAGCPSPIEVRLYPQAPTPIDNSWLIANQNVVLNTVQEVGLQNPFGIIPDLMPQSNAAVWNKAGFLDAKISDPFFERVNYVGAFGDTNWMLGWTNFDPVNTLVSHRVIEPENPAFSIYPSPGADFFQILMPENIHAINLRVINVQGRVMIDAQDIGKQARVDTRSWPAGMYWIHIQSIQQAQILSWVKWNR